jgi:hypothetical protein
MPWMAALNAADTGDFAGLDGFADVLDVLFQRRGGLKVFCRHLVVDAACLVDVLKVAIFVGQQSEDRALKVRRM